MNEVDQTSSVGSWPSDAPDAGLPADPAPDAWPAGQGQPTEGQDAAAGWQQGDPGWGDPAAQAGWAEAQNGWAQADPNAAQAQTGAWQTGAYPAVGAYRVQEAAWPSAQAAVPPVAGYPQSPETTQRRGMPRWHAPMIVGIAMLCAAAFAAAGFAAGRWGGGPAQAAPTYAAMPASVVATAAPSNEATASAEATTTTAATDVTVEDTIAPVTAAKTVSEPPPSKIVYRSGGYLYVVSVTGGDAKKVVKSSDGPYSVSPDAKWIAVADQEQGNLLMIEVASGKTTSIGQASRTQPAWAPDSSWVVYANMEGDFTYIMRVKPGAKSPSKVTKGTAPRVAPDGKTIFFIDKPGADEFGYPSSVPVQGGTAKRLATFMALEVAPGKQGIVYSGGGSDKGLYTAKLDGSSVRKLLGPPTDSGTDSYTRLFMSPDGKQVGFDRSGAAGVFRLAVIPWAGGAQKDLSGGANSYDLGWSPDGKALLYMTGNPEQDTTAVNSVYRVGPDGSGRKKL